MNGIFRPFLGGGDLKQTRLVILVVYYRYIRDSLSKALKYKSPAPAAIAKKIRKVCYHNMCRRVSAHLIVRYPWNYARNGTDFDIHGIAPINGAP